MRLFSIALVAGVLLTTAAQAKVCVVHVADRYARVACDGESREGKYLDGKVENKLSFALSHVASTEKVQIIGCNAVETVTGQGMACTLSDHK